MPHAACDEYTDRGEGEHRNKEVKCGLAADRISDHRYFAHLFRLDLHATAYNLIIHTRGEVVDPLRDSTIEDLPADALTGHRRRPWHNRRQHEQDDHADRQRGLKGLPGTSGSCPATHTS